MQRNVAAVCLNLSQMVIGCTEIPWLINMPPCMMPPFMILFFRYIATKTERGKVLDEFPLTMIGVDFNLASLRETTKTLKGSKVPHTVLWGDIGDPAQMVVDIEASPMLRDAHILHIRSFLDHDRPTKEISRQEELACRERWD